MSTQANGLNGHATSAHDSDAPLSLRSTPPAGPPLDVRAIMRGKRLLILGGTGFLGKVFWSLLLSRYPEIERVYLLVRAGKGRTSEERFWADVASSAALDPFREAYPGAAYEAFLRDKIVPIDGDVGRAKCGIDAALIDTLRGTIDAVVNVAGVVDFTPPLDEALNANAFGAKNLVELTRALSSDAKATKLLHTSTCYVAGRPTRPAGSEKGSTGAIFEAHPLARPFPRCEELGRDLWDPEREISDCLDIIEQAKHRCDDAFRQSEFREKSRANLLKRSEPTEGAAFDEELARVRRKFVSDRLVAAGQERATHWGWPNTYTYTKSIGEQVIASSGVPFTIVRPACCESTLRFPFPGWNEGISTSVPIVYLVMKGAMQVPATEVILDFIPTDMVCAGMVLSLAELLEGTQKPVYQYGASDVNPATAKRLGELVGLYKRRHFQKTGKGNPLFNWIQAHYEPAFVDEARFRSFGSPAIAKATKGIAGALKSMAVGPAAGLLKPASKMFSAIASAEEKSAYVMNLFVPFTTMNNGPFSAANTRSAYARLRGEDRELLKWDPEAIDWSDWMLGVHLPAVERWILPEMEKKLRREPKALRAHTTIVSMIDELAARHGDSVALQRLEQEHGIDALTRVTYAELRARRDATAARLASCGVTQGARIAIAAGGHPDWAIACFGALRAGATVVPMDPSYDAETAVRVLRASGAVAAIIDADVRAKWAATITLELPNVTLFDLNDVTIDDQVLVPPDVVVQADDIASLLFTSGTTGEPKAVRLSHGNFTALIAALAPLFPIGHGDRVLSVLPLHHTFEFACGLLLPLSRGARVAYLDKLNGERLSIGLQLSRATAMVGVPAVWQLLERRIIAGVKEQGALVETAFSFATELNRLLGKTLGIDAGRVLFGPVHAQLGGHVRHLISGGAALPKETHKLFSGLGLHLSEGYGLTEASPVLTVASSKSPPGQVGKAIPGVELKILDPDRHGVGEVIARGPNVMRGYTDDEATAQAIDVDGWLHTGDLGKLDAQARLTIVGRAKEIIVTSTGENVHPDDVERRIGDLSTIEELAVVAVALNGVERIGCLAVPKSDGDLARGDRQDRAMASLREAIAKLPIAMQPTVVNLYEAPLPRTSTRKVKRREVARILERIAIASRPSTTAHGAEDATPIREAIATVSGKSLATVTPHATLLGDLALDSLTLTELLVALEARFGAIEPTALAACLTVDDVERLLAGRRTGVLRAHTAKPEPSRAVRIEGRTPAEARVTEPSPFDLPEPARAVVKTAIAKAQEAFYRDGLCPTVTGRAFIPHDRPTIVVANHASHLDMGLVKFALGSYGQGIVTLAAQDYFFDGSPLRRAFFEQLTNLRPLDRKGVRASMRQAGELLDRGETVLIFPEGTRSPDGEIHEFKSMVGWLALHHDVDLLPIFLGGTREAMPKGAIVPLRRDVRARVGLPLTTRELRRLTAGLSSSEAAREASKIAREAVLALRDGRLLDLATVRDRQQLESQGPHPLVALFEELETRFLPGGVNKAISFYFTLGADDLAKWTVKVAATTCEVRNGKPDGGAADCVLKTSPELFTRIVREAFMPGPAEFLSGAIKSNDVELLMSFQRAFRLGDAWAPSPGSTKGVTA